VDGIATASATSTHSAMPSTIASGSGTPNWKSRITIE
jgi:hypothetical protein